MNEQAIDTIVYSMNTDGSILKTIRYTSGITEEQIEHRSHVHAPGTRGKRTDKQAENPADRESNADLVLFYAANVLL